MIASTSEIQVSEDIKLFNEKYNQVQQRFPKEIFMSYEAFKK